MKKFNEAEELAKRFKDVENREEFARDNGLKGGGAMIYQHITGRKPISMKAAIAYAKGFNCSIADISPSNAEVNQDAANVTLAYGIPVARPIFRYPEIAEVVTYMENTDPTGRRLALDAVVIALNSYVVGKNAGAGTAKVAQKKRQPKTAEV